MKKINLGESVPTGLMGDAPVEVKEDERIMYPSLHIHGSKSDQLAKLPKKGKAIIEFEVVDITVTSRNGKANTSTTLDIHSIEPMPSKKVRETLRPETEESESAMDALLSEI